MFLESRDFDPNPPPTSEEDEFMPSLPCSLCASSTPLQSLVFCTREHPYCIDCVKSYMTLTPSAMNANLSNITCVTPKCHGVFERKDVCKILGPYETLVRQERDEEVRLIGRADYSYSRRTLSAFVSLVPSHITNNLMLAAPLLAG